MLMLTTCCNRLSQHERILVDIDSLTETNADSARRMLIGMKEEMENADEETKAYYNLLRVKADDKAHVEHTSDSLITAVAEYYKKHIQSGHLPEAYYYVGRVNSDLRHGERAILFYQKALLEDSIHVTVHLKSRIYAQLGYIYLRNKLYEDAITMQQVAYFYCKQEGDTLGMRYSSEDIETITKLAQLDSVQDDMSKKEMMMKVQKLNEQAKSQVLYDRNERLKEENAQTQMKVWGISIASILIIAVTILVLRRQRKLKKEEAAKLFLSTQSKRQFYDKDIDQLLTTHIYNNKVLKEAEWKQMEERLLDAFPTFRERLFALYPLSDTEYRICMLIKMEVAPSNIAKLMALGTSAVSQNRLRMQQKVFDGKGTAKDWDKFILSL